MREHDSRDEWHDRPWESSLTGDPADEQECQQRQQRPRQTRRHHPRVNAALDAAGQAGRERGGHERARQRQPPVAQHASEQQPDRDPGRQVREPDERLIARRDRHQPARHHVKQRDRVRKPGRIELELRVAAPPARVPRPRRRAVVEHVPDSIQLPGVIIEPDQRGAERPRRERDAVRQQQDQRHETLDRHPGDDKSRPDPTLTSPRLACVVAEMFVLSGRSRRSAWL